MTSYYDVLGVDRDADLEEVRRAYYRKAQRLHPDRHGSASDPERQRAEAEMKAVNEAWNTLRNSEARRRYDTSLGLAEDADPWEDEEPLPPSGFSRTGVRLAVVLVLVVSIVASVIAAVSQSDDGSPRWSASAIAELRFAALNAGLSAPQAECFVQVITSRYAPSEPVDRSVQQQIIDACR